VGGFGYAVVDGDILGHWFMWCLIRTLGGLDGHWFWWLCCSQEMIQLLPLLCLCVPLPLRDPLVHNVYVTPCFLSYMSQHSDFGSSAERADCLITKKWNIAFRLQGTSIQLQLGDGNILA